MSRESEIADANRRRRERERFNRDRPVRTAQRREQFERDANERDEYRQRYRGALGGTPAWLDPYDEDDEGAVTPSPDPTEGVQALVQSAARSAIEDDRARRAFARDPMQETPMALSADEKLSAAGDPLALLYAAIKMIEDGEWGVANYNVSRRAFDDVVELQFQLAPARLARSVASPSEVEMGLGDRPKATAEEIAGAPLGVPIRKIDL